LRAVSTVCLLPSFLVLGNDAKIELILRSSFPLDFFSSILKDIRMERQKVREADNVRALFLSTFFIEFFLCSRARALARESDKKGKVARMRLTMDDKVSFPHALL
jgi:superfamily II helicase